MENINYETLIHTIYNGVDWIYTYTENLYIFDYQIIYLWVLGNAYDESLDFFFLFMWYSSLQSTSLQLFWSVILDMYIVNNLQQFSLSDEWFRGYMSGKDTALFTIYHPEIIFFKNQILNNYFFSFLADVNITAIQYLRSQSLLSPVMLLPQFFFIFYLIFFFLSITLSFYSNHTKEESTTDADYLSSSVMVESEKEFGSIDDLFIPAVLFIYIFGWYFYLYVWTTLSIIPEIVVVIFFMPLITHTIVSLPTFLIYDFGIVYNCYIRGTQITFSLALELLYDYVTVICFYVRVIFQATRFVLMFVAYASMHDFIIYSHINRGTFLGFESIWEEISNLETSIPSITYFLIGTAPKIIVYLWYEILHTFFVVTGQAIVYVIMVFWLFIFLFTFFIMEAVENHFHERRKFRQNLLKKIKNTKNISNLPGK